MGLVLVVVVVVVVVVFELKMLVWTNSIDCLCCCDSFVFLKNVRSLIKSVTGQCQC